MHTAPKQPGYIRVCNTARAYGWTVESGSGWAYISREGKRTVNIEWSVSGAITYAFDGHRGIKGRGKAEQLMSYLRENGEAA